MEENATMNYEKQKTVAILLSAGINPKYRAFAYIMYLVQNFRSDEIISMTNKQMTDMICERFSVRSDKVVANFKCLMEAGAYSGGRKSVIFSMLPRLGKSEYPSIHEFMIAVNCYINIIKYHIIHERNSNQMTGNDMNILCTDAESEKGTVKT